MGSKEHASRSDRLWESEFLDCRGHFMSSWPFTLAFLDGNLVSVIAKLGQKIFCRIKISIGLKKVVNQKISITLLIPYPLVDGIERLKVSLAKRMNEARL